MENSSALVVAGLGAIGVGAKATVSSALSV